MEIPYRIVLRMNTGNGSPNHKEEFRMKCNKNRILTGVLAAVPVLSVGAPQNKRSGRNRTVPAGSLRFYGVCIIFCR